MESFQVTDHLRLHLTYSFLAALLQITQPFAIQCLLCGNTFFWVFVEHADDQLPCVFVAFGPYWIYIFEIILRNYTGFSRIFYIIYWLLRPVKGGLPQSRMYRMTPQDHTSHF